VTALGLRRLNHSVVRPANLQTLGMVRRVPHLVRVEVVADGGEG
jgi:ribosomal protein L30/L7E